MANFLQRRKNHLHFLYKVNEGNGSLKLKLETHEGTTILEVSEGIDLQQVAILKAGLNKIFQTGRRVILLDLTPLDVTQPPTGGVLTELLALPAWATDADAQLLVASGTQGLGQAKTRAEGLTLIDAPLFRLENEEGRLRSKLKRLHARKAEMEASLTALGNSAGPLAQEQKKNSDLRRLVADLEVNVRRRFRSRTGPKAQEPITADNSKDPAFARIQGIEKTLIAILEQEGLLPVS
jgi:hypothetical protein